MARLAIKGHSTRGKEVIEILGMLGGKTHTVLCGNLTFRGYYIKSDGFIDYLHHSVFNNDIIYSLEEFLEKYPYKVGDKVIAYAEGCLAQFTIQGMRWNYESNKVEYKICSSWYDASLMQPYKEEKKETMESKPNLLQQLKEYFDNTPRDILEKEWNELSYLNEIGPTIDEYLECVKKYRQQNQYPKTYEECCDILNIPSNGNIAYVGNWVYGGEYLEKHLDRLRKFQQLLICRDAYWKFAGEQMGLDKLWKPYNGQESYKKHVIQTVYDKVTCLDTWCQTRNILEFPTAEMRDVFYENFKELIESCKELL